MAPTTDRASDVMESMMPAQLQDKLSQLRENLDDVDTRVRATVRARPIVSVLGALVGGYLIGRMVARR